MTYIKRIALICAIALTLSVATSCSQEADSNNDKDSKATTQVTEITTQSDSSDTSISESETESTTDSSVSDDDSSKKDSSNTESSKSDSSAVEKKTTTKSTETSRDSQTVTNASTTKATTKNSTKATSTTTTKATSKTTQANNTVYGSCKFCGKSCTSANGVKFNRTANPTNPVYLILCNSCKDTKCLFCGKVCNSSNANKSNAAYYGQNIGYYWRCYTCCPHLKPWQGNEKEAVNAANEVLQYTNQLRTSNGLKAFKTDSRVTAAQARAKELAIKYAHSRPDGSAGGTIFNEYMQDNGGRIGENIQMGNGTGYDDATSIYNAWLNSSGHKATMLRSDFNYVGIGVYYVEKNGVKYTYAVQLFREKV